MTRLTLDTIALCGFNYRFNSFYRDTPHPFVVAMLGALEAAQAQVRELPIQRALNRKRARDVQVHQELMVRTVQRIIQERRAAGATGTVNDLLDRMLTGVDRQSGEALDETNIIAQCITFLIAGHETTSGLLSFALYALLKNPDVLAHAYDEVDRVLGTDLSVLPSYVQAHQGPMSPRSWETLRLWPTAPAFTRRLYEDTVIGGKYRLEEGHGRNHPGRDAAPGQASLGREPGGLRSGRFQPGEPGPDPTQCLQALRHRAPRALTALILLFAVISAPLWQ